MKTGLIRAEWRDRPEGMTMEWSDEKGLALFAFYDKPRKEEMEEMVAGKRFEIAFKDIESVGFFSVKFGNLSWGDCGFIPHFNKERPRFAKPPRGKTYSLTVFLVDISVGQLKMVRTIALGTDFSDHFRSWCLKNLERDIGSFHYNRVIDEVFKTYSSAGELAKEADARWLCAHGEDEQRREEKREEKEWE